MEERVIKNESIKAFEKYLLTEEKAENTVEKYLRDVRAFIGFVGGAVTKEAVIAYKNRLTEQVYTKRSINSMLCSVNAFLHFLGRDDCRVKLLKLQCEVFCREEKELTKRNLNGCAMWHYRAETGGSICSCKRFAARESESANCNS